MSKPGGEDWSSLELPEGFGEIELAADDIEPRQAAPENMSEVLPLSLTGPIEQRPSWLLAMRQGRVTITEPWKEIGSPPLVSVAPRPGSRAVVVAPQQTAVSSGWATRPVRADRSSARVQLPREAVAQLQLRSGDMVLVVVDSGCLLLGNPEWLDDFRSGGSGR